MVAAAEGNEIVKNSEYGIVRVNVGGIEVR